MTHQFDAPSLNSHLERLHTLASEWAQDPAEFERLWKRYLELLTHLQAEDGTVTEAHWTALPEVDRLRYGAEILALIRAFNFASRNGPSETNHLMSSVYASNGTIWTLLCLALGGTALCLLGIYGQWNSATDPGAPEDLIFGVVVLMGALGALLHLTTSLATYVGNRQLRRSWVLYYLLLPLEGAALAPLVYLTFRVGLLGGFQTQKVAAENLNHQAFFLMAGLTGMFSRSATELLSSLFARIFQKVDAKDPLTQPKKPAGKP